MSRQLRQSDYREPYQLGDQVEFDGPYGERLTG